MGSHTPVGAEQEILLVSLWWWKIMARRQKTKSQNSQMEDGRWEEGGLTFLTAPPRISLQAGAHIVPHAKATIFTRRTADSWRKERFL